MTCASVAARSVDGIARFAVLAAALFAMLLLQRWRLALFVWSAAVGSVQLCAVCATLCRACARSFGKLQSIGEAEQPLMRLQSEFQDP